MIVLMILTTLITPFAQGESKKFDNPFLGKWCASKDNKYRPDQEITFENGQTIVSVDSSGEVDWRYTYNPDTRLIVGNMEFKVGPKGKRQHPEKDNGIGVLFDISSEGKLVWTGPILEAEFLSINRGNVTNHLLMDARVYNMTYEPCEYLGY